MWHGHELWVETQTEGAGGGRNDPGWSRKCLTSLGLMGERVGMLGKRRHLPPELEPHREDILKDLYDALLAYKDLGALSSSTTYELIFEIVEGGRYRYVGMGGH
jgi:hypothetical protein